jgi:hypothetical protein
MSNTGKDPSIAELARSLAGLRRICLATSFLALAGIGLAAWAVWPREVIRLKGDHARIELVSGSGVRRAILEPYGISLVDTAWDSEVSMHAFPVAHMTFNAAGPNGRYPRVQLGVGLQREGYLSLEGSADEGGRDIHITPDAAWDWLHSYGLSQARLEAEEREKAAKPDKTPTDVGQTLTAPEPGAR